MSDAEKLQRNNQDALSHLETTLSAWVAACSRSSDHAFALPEVGHVVIMSSDHGSVNKSMRTSAIQFDTESVEAWCLDRK